MELISLYECSHVVAAGHSSGLRWRPAAPEGGRPAPPAATAIETALRPYEAHHLPQPG